MTRLVLASASLFSTPSKLFGTFFGGKGGGGDDDGSSILFLERTSTDWHRLMDSRDFLFTCAATPPVLRLGLKSQKNFCEGCFLVNNVNKIDNFSREIKVCQNNVNISNNFEFFSWNRSLFRYTSDPRYFSFETWSFWADWAQWKPLLCPCRGSPLKRPFA